MIYTEKTKSALKLCFEAHKEQLDKGGIPYVFHPFHLAEQMKSENAVIVALLHDVVEDTDITLAQLEKEGFGDEVIDALRLLTHKRGTDYMAYVHAIKENSLATEVKLADLAHNSDLTRADVIDDTVLKRREEYLEAIEILQK